MKTTDQQIFLLHFAGGNAYSYQFLKPFFPSNIEVHCLELPGRGRRITAPRLHDKNRAVEDLVHQLTTLRDGTPYVIYGHSMGATLGFEVCRKMEEKKDAPLTFVASGNSGPGTGIKKNRYLMTKEDLKKDLRSLGGFPEEILENEELFDFFEPIIRGDFQILEEDQGEEPTTPINTGIVCLMGESEETVARIDNWKTYTTGNFSSRTFAGDHFFIYNYPKELVSIIKSSYDSVKVY